MKLQAVLALIAVILAASPMSFGDTFDHDQQNLLIFQGFVNRQIAPAKDCPGQLYLQIANAQIDKDARAALYKELFGHGFFDKLTACTALRKALNVDKGSLAGLTSREALAAYKTKKFKEIDAGVVALGSNFSSEMKADPQYQYLPAYKEDYLFQALADQYKKNFWAPFAKFEIALPAVASSPNASRDSPAAPAVSSLASPNGPSFDGARTGSKAAQHTYWDLPDVKDMQQRAGAAFRMVGATFATGAKRFDPQAYDLAKSTLEWSRYYLSKNPAIGHWDNNVKGQLETLEEYIRLYELTQKLAELYRAGHDQPGVTAADVTEKISKEVSTIARDYGVYFAEVPKIKDDFVAVARSLASVPAGVSADAAAMVQPGGSQAGIIAPIQDGTNLRGWKVDTRGLRQLSESDRLDMARSYAQDIIRTLQWDAKRKEPLAQWLIDFGLRADAVYIDPHGTLEALGKASKGWQAKFMPASAFDGRLAEESLVALKDGYYQYSYLRSGYRLRRVLSQAPSAAPGLVSDGKIDTYYTIYTEERIGATGNPESWMSVHLGGSGYQYVVETKQDTGSSAMSQLQSLYYAPLMKKLNDAPAVGNALQFMNWTGQLVYHGAVGAGQMAMGKVRGDAYVEMHGDASWSKAQQAWYGVDLIQDYENVSRVTRQNGVVQVVFSRQPKIIGLIQNVRAVNPKMIAEIDRLVKEKREEEFRKLVRRTDMDQRAYERAQTRFVDEAPITDAERGLALLTRAGSGTYGDLLARQGNGASWQIAGGAMGFLESQGQGLPSLLLLYGLGKLAALKAVAPGQVAAEGETAVQTTSTAGQRTVAVLRGGANLVAGSIPVGKWTVNGPFGTFLRLQWIGNVPNGVVALVQAIDEGDLRKFTESLAQVVTDAAFVREEVKSYQNARAQRQKVIDELTQVRKGLDDFLRKHPEAESGEYRMAISEINRQLAQMVNYDDYVKAHGSLPPRAERPPAAPPVEPPAAQTLQPSVASARPPSYPLARAAEPPSRSSLSVPAGDSAGALSGPTPEPISSHFSPTDWNQINQGIDTIAKSLEYEPLGSRFEGSLTSNVMGNIPPEASPEVREQVRVEMMRRIAAAKKTRAEPADPEALKRSALVLALQEIRENHTLSADNISAILAKHHVDTDPAERLRLLDGIGRSLPEDVPRPWALKILDLNGLESGNAADTLAPAPVGLKSEAYPTERGDAPLGSSSGGDRASVHRPAASALAAGSLAPDLFSARDPATLAAKYPDFMPDLKSANAPIKMKMALLDSVAKSWTSEKGLSQDYAGLLKTAYAKADVPEGLSQGGSLADTDIVNRALLDVRSKSANEAREFKTSTQIYEAGKYRPPAWTETVKRFFARHAAENGEQLDITETRITGKQFKLGNCSWHAMTELVSALMDSMPQETRPAELATPAQIKTTVLDAIGEQTARTMSQRQLEARITEIESGRAQSGQPPLTQAQSAALRQRLQHRAVMKTFQGEGQSGLYRHQIVAVLKAVLDGTGYEPVLSERGQTVASMLANKLPVMVPTEAYGGHVFNITNPRVTEGGIVFDTIDSNNPRADKGNPAFGRLAMGDIFSILQRTGEDQEQGKTYVIALERTGGAPGHEPASSAAPGANLRGADPGPAKPAGLAGFAEKMRAGWQKLVAPRPPPGPVGQPAPIDQLAVAETRPQAQKAIETEFQRLVAAGETGKAMALADQAWDRVRSLPDDQAKPLNRWLTELLKTIPQASAPPAIRAPELETGAGSPVRDDVHAFEHAMENGVGLRPGLKVNAASGHFFRGVLSGELQRILEQDGLVPRVYQHEYGQTAPSETLAQAITRRGVAAVVVEHTNGITPYLTGVTSNKEVADLYRIAKGAAPGALLRITTDKAFSTSAFSAFSKEADPTKGLPEDEFVIPGVIRAGQVDIFDPATGRWLKLDTPEGKQVGKRILDASAPTTGPPKTATGDEELDHPVPLSTPGKPNATRAVLIDGRDSNKYLGIPVAAPQMAGRLPRGTTGRREFHITIITPPEWDALPANVRAQLAHGADIDGSPSGGKFLSNSIAGTPAYQMEVKWPQAQALRAKLGLPAKEFHVSLSGGIGDAVRMREVAANAPPVFHEPLKPTDAALPARVETPDHGYDYHTRTAALAGFLRAEEGLPEDTEVSFIGDPKNPFAEVYAVKVAGQVVNAFRIHTADAAQVVSVLNRGSSLLGAGLEPSDDVAIVNAFRFSNGDVGVFMAPENPGAYSETLVEVEKARARGDVLSWAESVERLAPFYEHDPIWKRASDERYQSRNTEIDDLYRKVMNGERPPKGITPYRLKLASKGDPINGERIPLNFKTIKQFREFQADLAQVFRDLKIDDAIVQQVGSATKGWRGNPNKPLGEWQASSDSDFAIFSKQALAAAMHADVPVNPKISMNGRHTVLKNGEPGEGGFADTPLGTALTKLSQDWNEKIYGKRDIDGFDFKLNLTTEPFEQAITVYPRKSK
jgi:hypothetical protein